MSAALVWLSLISSLASAGASDGVVHRPLRGGSVALSYGDDGRARTWVDARQAQGSAQTELPVSLQGLSGLAILRPSGADAVPMLRGLMGSRVQILVDGVPLNTTLLSAGQASDLNAIELSSVDHVEVFAGASPGPTDGGALGGVVGIYTRQPRFVDEGFDFSAGLGAAYQGASQAATGRVYVEGASPELALRVGGDLAQYENLRAGRGSGVQDFSSYRRGGLASTLRYRPRSGHELRLSYLALRQLDAPYPHLCQRSVRGTVLDCQRRTERFIDLASLAYLGRAGLVFDSVDAQLSLQNNHQRRERRRRDTARLHTRVDQVLSVGSRVRLQRSLRLGEALALRLRLGAEVEHQLVDSEAFAKSLRMRDAVPAQSLGAREPGASTFADGATASQASIFVQQHVQLGGLRVLGIARYTGVTVEARDDPRLGRDLQRVFAAPSASLRAEGALSSWLRLGAGLVHRFRAPNIYDLTARDNLDGGFEFANAQRLGPERLTGAEASLRLDLGRLSVDGSAFAYLVSDLIVRQPAVFAGRSIHNSAPVSQRVNTSAALLTGAELLLRLRLPAHSELYSSFSYTYGQDLGHDEPLSRVPPPRGVVGLRSRPLAGLFVEADARWALAQKRLSARDRADPRIAEGGTPAYLVAGLGASYELAQHFQIGMRLHNLFDATYRVHGSALDGPGAEGRVQLELRF